MEVGLTEFLRVLGFFEKPETGKTPKVLFSNQQVPFGKEAFSPEDPSAAQCMKRKTP